MCQARCNYKLNFATGRSGFIHKCLSCSNREKFIILSMNHIKRYINFRYSPTQFY